MAKLSKSKYLIFGLGVLLVLGLGFYFNEQVEGPSVFSANNLNADQSKSERTVFDQKNLSAKEEGDVDPLMSSDSDVAQEVGVSSDDSLEDGFGFSSVEELLDNMDNPRVQRYIESLPDEAQESIYVASLKQSVSTRLDEMEESGVLTSDPQTLFEDLDTLSVHGLMMPGEVEGLKAYIRTRF